MRNSNCINFSMCLIQQVACVQSAVWSLVSEVSIKWSSLFISISVSAVWIMEPEPSTWRVHPVRLFSEPMEKCVELKASLLACPSMRSLHAEYFQPQKRNYVPTVSLYWQRRIRRRSGNICGKQSRERDISEGAEVGVMTRWESGEMLMWLLWGH